MTVPCITPKKLVMLTLLVVYPYTGGSKTALQFFNPKAFLFLEDPTDQGIRNLIQKIIEIDTNEELYQKMRQEPLFELSSMNSVVENVKNIVKSLI